MLPRDRWDTIHVGNAFSVSPIIALTWHAGERNARNDKVDDVSKRLSRTISLENTL